MVSIIETKNTIKSFSEYFQKYKDKSFVNLNNGTLGLCPDSVIDAQIEELKNFELNTSKSLGHSWDKLWSIQNKLADFLNAKPEDLFLRPNVTLALNEVIMGLKLPGSPLIVTTNHEYGAVLNILKHRAQISGGRVLQIDLDSILAKAQSEAEFLEILLNEIPNETSLFCLSHIFTGSGFEIPLFKLGKALQHKNIISVIDGAHGPGLSELNFSELSNIDFYCGNLHKWMMGPKGTAFSWAHPSKQNLLLPCFASWTTQQNIPPQMKRFGEEGSFASRMLWSHSCAFSSYFGLAAALDFWQVIGAHEIRNQLKLRSDFLRQELKSVEISEFKSVLKAPILSYDISNLKVEFDDLFIKGTNVQVGLPRLPDRRILRLTPHIHNTIEELEHAVRAIKTAL